MSEYVPTTEQVRLSAADMHANRVSRPAFDRWLAAVKAAALREAVFEMRRLRQGHWNLPDPRDPDVAYSVDRWLEVRADRIESEVRP